MRHLLHWIPIVVALGVGVGVARWQPLQFVPLGGADFASKFGVIAFFSLLIERTVEILMSVWRSKRSNELEAVAQGLVASKVSATDSQMVTAQKELAQFKAETIQWTMPLGFALGLVVAGFGVRALSQFIDVKAGVPSGNQLWWFNMSDIVFTGALLAGGADPIHKILDLYRKFMENTSAKTAGTKP